ncbi:MAG: HDIG domain-containing metalloprotein [Dehalococcoidia bacterium]
MSGRATKSLTPQQLLLFGAVLTGALVLALFPFFPRQLRVNEGDVASRTIRSPQGATFESEVLTDQAREAAAQAVPEVLVFDPNVRTEQAEKLATATEAIAQVRDNPALDATVKRAQLLAIENLSGLSRGSIDTVLTLPPDRWQRVAGEAEQLLGRSIGQSIAPDGVQAAQDGLLEQVGLALAADEANLVADLVRPLVVATLVVDDQATQGARGTARQNVQPVQQTIAENQVLVQEGQPIDPTAIEALEEVGLLTSRVEWDKLGAVAVVSVLAALILTLYLHLFPAPGITSPRNLVFLALIVALPVLLAKVYVSLVLPEDGRRFLIYVLPFAAAPMLVATLLEARLAITIALVQMMLLCFSVIYLPDTAISSSLQPLEVGRLALAYGLGAVAGVFAVQRADRLNQYVMGGVIVAIVMLAGLFAFWLIDPDRRPLDIPWMTTAAAISGLGSGVLTAGGFAAVAAFLGITTRVQLLELSQLNAPLLRRLQDEAPGTFHHSIIVGNLAERAADLIGADALLVRVGCYYHDIGKALQPGFYIENQLGGANPHDEMEPRDSARVIRQHVRGGLELARRHGLPVSVQAFIPEHHGTRLIAYFYRVASQREGNVDQSAFRYPGPRPQTRETAIVMLADSTEAMVRASADRSPERIDVLVEEVIAERLAEGELDECDLTLRDIRTIAESFKQTLRGVYHPRIAYPEATEQERRALIGRFRPGRRAAQPLPQAPGPSQEQRPTW